MTGLDRRWTVPSALLAALLVSASGCGEPTDHPPAPEAELRVGERVVEEGELRRFLLREVGLPQKQIDARALPAYRRDLLRQLLFARAATRMGLELDSVEVERELEILRELAPKAPAARLEQEARRAVLARAYESEVLARQVDVTEEEVEARLRERPRDRERTIVFRQIVVSDGDRARELHRSLARGEGSFQKRAAEVSEGPERGALQQVPIGHLPEPVQDVLRRTREGRVSPPVEIEGRYYLFEVQAQNRDPDPARRRERQEVRRRLIREKLDELRREHVSRLARSEGVELPPGGDA